MRYFCLLLCVVRGFHILVHESARFNITGPILIQAYGATVRHALTVVRVRVRVRSVIFVSFRVRVRVSADIW